MTETTARCEIKVGFFLLRPCGRSAQQQCGRCGKWSCRDHLDLLSKSGITHSPSQQAAPLRLCVDCRKLEDNSTNTSRDTRSETSPSSSTSSSDPVWKGGGGSSAGAGATGAWLAASANPPLPLEQSTLAQHGDPTLTPQDIAVFDQVTHADESRTKDGSFDS